MTLPWDDTDFTAAWEEWVEYRKERKLPKYVPKGLQKTLTMLYNLSGGQKDVAIKIINQSMEQNYQGLFRLKNNSNEANSQPSSGQLGTSAARIQTAKDW